MELRIREFQKQDMDAIYFLDQEAYPEAQRSSYSALLDALLDRDSAALVAEEIEEGHTRIIGAMIVLADPWRSKLYIVSLMVNQEFRRLGIARRLLGWAEKLARGFGFDALLVRLPDDDAPGEAFLSANSFAVSGDGGGDGGGEAPEAGPGVLWIREVADETAS